MIRLLLESIYFKVLLVTVRWLGSYVYGISAGNYVLNLLIGHNVSWSKLDSTEVTDKHTKWLLVSVIIVPCYGCVLSIAIILFKNDKREDKVLEEDEKYG